MQTALVQKPLVSRASCKAAARGRSQLVCQAQRQEQGLASKVAAVSALKGRRRAFVGALSYGPSSDLEPIDAFHKNSIGN